MHVLGELKSVELVKRIGYGTWEINEEDNDENRRCKIVHRVASTHTPQKVQKPDTVRAHGIQAVVKISRQRLLNWSKEELAIVLKEREIPFIPIPQGQRIQVLDVKKVWLTRKSVVYYLPYSWFGETAHENAAKVMEDVIRLNLRLERMLGIDTLKIGGSYWIKFSRQHDALIKNALAMMYDNPRRPIYFRDERGQWGLIDNSWNLHELETTRGEREFQPIKPDKPIAPQVRENDDGAREHNRHLQNFMNGVKDTGLTPEFILQRFAETARDIQRVNGHMGHYSQHLNTHVSSIRGLDEKVGGLGSSVNTLALQAQENAKSTVSLREAVQRLAATVRMVSIPADLRARLPEDAVKTLEKRASEPLSVAKQCALCRQKARIQPGTVYCRECGEIVSEWKRPTRVSTIGEHLIS